MQTLADQMRGGRFFRVDEKTGEPIVDYALSLRKAKNPDLAGPGVGWFVSRSLAADGHVRSAGPLGAIRDLELDLVTFVEGAEAVGPNLRVVHENVRTTFPREETETLGLVEPLDSTFDHERAGLLSLCLAATSPARSQNKSRPPRAAPSETPEQRPTNAVTV